VERGYPPVAGVAEVLAVAVVSAAAVAADFRGAAAASAAAARRAAGKGESMPGKAHRLLRHVVTDHLSVKRAFAPDVLSHIEHAIAAGERTHRGQVCFAVEGSLPPLRVLRKLTPRERALEVFGLLRVWDTEENAGVLVYLLL